MLLMGDEYGHTRRGNNNPYVEDNEITWFLWNKINEEILSFIKTLIAFRQKNPLFRRTKFLTDKDIAWHGHNPNKPDWSAESRFVAFSQQKHYVAFNADYRAADVTLPEGTWRLLVDTSKGWSEQPLIQGKPGSPIAKITLPPYSAVLMEK
jgi:isoamylase/glycogen operon protein